MLITKISQRFVYEEFKANNEYRIEKYGVHPLCKKCAKECKRGMAKDLIWFWCSDFDDGGQQ